MVEIDALGVSIEFGLHLIEQNANLTFIFFLGVSLLAALGLRFSYYAHENMRRTAIESQREIWAVLRYIGLFAALYAVSWLLDIVTSLSLAGKNGLLLAMSLSLVVSLRQIATATGQDGLAGSTQLDSALTVGFVGAIGLYTLVGTVLGQHQLTALLEGLIGVGIIGYGFVLFQQQISETRLQGTMLDSLIRHLFPVLVFASLVSIVALVIPAGIDFIIVLHIQIVFLIMTATSLMTATIKLRQNLAAL